VESEIVQDIHMKNLALLIILGAVAVLAAFAPPSGRPPIGPLERYEPRLYDLSFAVNVSTLRQVDGLDKQNYVLRGAPIVFPIVFQGTFSKVESNSVKPEMWLESRQTNPNFELKEGLPFNTHLATMTILDFIGQSVRWKIGYRTQSWSSRLNDVEAAKITWPKEWPKEVLDGLQPQMYIQSDDPIFKQTVENITKGRLRMVAPYLAAKDIIRFCLNAIQVNGSANFRDEHNVLRGMNVTGAAKTMSKKMGSPHDLVCVCVAMLRAAGIPARAVIGCYENEKNFGEFVTWAEFYLPECGWIPFDPYVMRGKNYRTVDIRKPWPEFGTMDDLNRRVVLSYHFLPSATIESPRDPAAWGWDPRPGRDYGSNQQIYIDITNRGRGVEDPK
jgi:hypothetical protein